MFSKYSLLFLVLNVYVFCESAFVDTLTKCQVNDRECNRKSLQKVIGEIAKTGVPELDIPPVDPIELKNVTVKVPDVMEISMLDGHAKGVRNCAFDKYELNIEDGRAYLELTCDITIKGKYKAFSNSPIIKNLLNGEVRGEGNGKVKIEKLKLKFNFFFFIQNRNGELYIKCYSDKTKYDYDVKGKMSFFADKIYIGEVESSKFVIGMLNQNWKFLMASFGKPIMDKAISFVYDFLHTFLDAIPTKYYIIDDLSSYARE